MPLFDGVPPALVNKDAGRRRAQRNPAGPYRETHAGSE
jgi:hypothetical protein